MLSLAFSIRKASGGGPNVEVNIGTATVCLPLHHSSFGVLGSVHAKLAMYCRQLALCCRSTMHLLGSWCRPELRGLQEHCFSQLFLTDFASLQADCGPVGIGSLEPTVQNSDDGSGPWNKYDVYLGNFGSSAAASSGTVQDYCSQYMCKARPPGSAEHASSKMLFQVSLGRICGMQNAM